jgi:hypothetical protein
VTGLASLPDVNSSDEAVEGRINDIIETIARGDYDSGKTNCQRLLEDHFDRLLKTAAYSNKTEIRAQRTATWCKTAIRYLEIGWYALALHAMESALKEWREMPKAFHPINRSALGRPS